LSPPPYPCAWPVKEQYPKWDTTEIKGDWPLTPIPRASSDHRVRMIEATGGKTRIRAYQIRLSFPQQQSPDQGDSNQPTITPQQEQMDSVDAE